MVNGVQTLNYGYDNYYLNNTYYNPVPLQYNNSIYDDNGASVPNDSKAKDGKDDGSIGFFSAVGHALKGGVKFITGMFTDENGDFSIKQTLKTAGLAAIIGLSTLIPVVGPFVLPTLCALGVADGGLKVAKGFVNAMDAKTDAEAEQAFENIGEGATEGLLSYVGYKQTGGFKGAWDKVKPTAPTSGAPTSSAPTSGTSTSGASTSEPVAQLEAPKTTEVTVTEKPVTDLAVPEKTPVKYTENPNASSSSANTNASSSSTNTNNTSSTGSANSSSANSSSANSTSANSSSATGSPKGSASATETQTVSENDKFISEIFGKVSSRRGGGINNLTTQEKAKLAEILDVPSSDLTHLSKAQIKNLTIKHHPDRGGSNEIMQLINYLKDTYSEPSFRAAA